MYELGDKENSPNSAPKPQLRPKGRFGSPTVWIILLGIVAGHLCVLVQGKVLPDYFHALDWWLSGAALSLVALTSVANFMRWLSSRTLISLLIVFNALFLLLKFAVALFVVGTTWHIQTELATLMLWTLTVPMLAASMRVTRAARLVSSALPLMLIAMSVVFALTPSGAKVQPEVWFGLFQLCVVCLTIQLASRFISSLRTELRRSQADNHALSQLAYYDDLTGLRNRVFLDAYLEQQCSSLTSMAVLFLDLDGFKTVNDTLGHAAGDEVLRQVAGRLSTFEQAQTCLARVSGDEFVFTLLDASTEQVTDVAQRLLSVLARPFTVEGQTLRLSASIGISHHPQDAADPHHLMLYADRAMYNAKRTGKNSFCFYNSAPQPEDRAQWLERELSLAQDRKQLSLTFEPICTLPSGQPVSVQARLCWEHAELGSMGEAALAPVAESSGLGAALSEWTVREALAAAQRWHARTSLPLPVAVSVSKPYLLQPHAVANVREALQSANLPARTLELHFSFSSLNSRQLEQLVQTLRQLNALGVKLVLCASGAGLAALAQLSELPLQRVALDQTFVADLLAGSRSQAARAFLLALVSVATPLELQVEAQGVQTTQQALHLFKLGCHLAQGAAFWPEMTEEALLRALVKLSAQAPYAYR